MCKFIVLYRKPFKDVTNPSKAWESLRDMKDVILMTVQKSNIEDTNSPRGPRLSIGSSSSLNSSNRSSPANSNDSLGRQGHHEVVNTDNSKHISSLKPLVSIVLYIFLSASIVLYYYERIDHFLLV